MSEMNADGERSVERARSTRGAKANAAWRNVYYRGFNDEIEARYERLRMATGRNAAGREPVVTRETQVERWMHANTRFGGKHPASSGTSRASRAAYCQGREAAMGQPLGSDEVTR